MQQLWNLDDMPLKRLARFLGVRPRLDWLFKWQKRVTRIESWCDTDHAGCIRTRKSVSGCASMLGDSTVSTYCIALSSGEAEYYGLVSATSQMLGLQSILLDWGWKFNAHVRMDATAGIAIGSRRGLGRVKHIDTVFFWVQAMVTEGRISLGKKPTKQMLADFLTKHVDATTMQSCMAGLGKQTNSESVILPADRDDCCAETWKLVTDGSGNANSGGYSHGTQSLHHDELMESEFNDTWRRAGRRQ